MPPFLPHPPLPPHPPVDTRRAADVAERVKHLLFAAAPHWLGAEVLDIVNAHGRTILKQHDIFPTTIPAGRLIDDDLARDAAQRLVVRVRGKEKPGKFVRLADLAGHTLDAPLHLADRRLVPGMVLNDTVKSQLTEKGYAGAIAVLKLPDTTVEMLAAAGGADGTVVAKAIGALKQAVAGTSFGKEAIETIELGKADGRLLAEETAVFGGARSAGTWVDASLLNTPGISKSAQVRVLRSMAPPAMSQLFSAETLIDVHAALVALNSPELEKAGLSAKNIEAHQLKNDKFIKYVIASDVISIESNRHIDDELAKLIVPPGTDIALNVTATAPGPAIKQTSTPKTNYVAASKAAGKYLTEDLLVVGPPVEPGTVVTDALLARRWQANGSVDVTVRREPPSPEPASALIDIFARLAERVIDRLNQAPDKAFLGFIDMVGARQLAPQPARVPLTFAPANGGASDIWVPRGTRVTAATAAAGETTPPVFETREDLMVSRAELVAFLSYTSGDKTAANHPEIVATGGGEMDERKGIGGVYIAHPQLGDTTGEFSVKISFTSDSATFPDLNWRRSNGGALVDVASKTIVKASGSYSVSLTLDTSVPETTVNGAKGNWLLARLLPGVEEEAYNITIKSIVISPPAVTSKALSIVGAQLIDGSVTDPIGVNTGGSFQIFGFQPKVGDYLLLEFDGNFLPQKNGDNSPNVIRLTFASDGATAASQDIAATSVRLAYEYWSGSDWRLLGQTGYANGKKIDPVSGGPDINFTDDTQAFMALSTPGNETKSFAVSFRRPADWLPSTVGSRQVYSLRIRIIQGGYGKPAMAAPVDPMDLTKGYTFSPVKWWPPQSKNLAAAQDATTGQWAPATVLYDDGAAAKDVTKMLQGDTPTGFVVTCPAAMVTGCYLGVDRSGTGPAFASLPVSLYVSAAAPEAAAKWTSAAAGRGGEAAAAVWEYYDGKTWVAFTPLDESRGLTRSGRVVIAEGLNLAKATLFGISAQWLRLRSDPLPPLPQHIVLNTTWADHVSHCVEILGSATGAPGQSLSTLRAPVLSGHCLEVREPDRPAGDVPPNRHAAVVEEDDGAFWVRWTAVGDFHASGPLDRHYVLDVARGAVRFGDGRNGWAPPVGKSNIRIAYRVGGGENGNLPPGSITKLMAAIPGIAAVTNYEASCGGSDLEPVEAMKRRGPRTLRHGGRAVALADYEDLALEASTMVARAGAKGAGSQTKITGGQVMVTIVARSDDPCPRPSPELLEDVGRYLQARALPTIQLTVREPSWIGVTLDATVTPTSNAEMVALKQRVDAAVTAYLHPLTGRGGNGWKFGQCPVHGEMVALIQSVAGVTAVNRLGLKFSPATADSSTLLIWRKEVNVTVLTAGSNTASARSTS